MDETKLPEWDFKNSFVSIEAKEYKEQLLKAQELKKELLNTDSTKELKKALELFEGAKDRLDALNLFVKCLRAKDSNDLSLAPQAELLRAELLDLLEVSKPLFKTLMLLKEDDEVWKEEPFSAWRFKISLLKNSYLNKIDESKAVVFNSLLKTSFYPLSDEFGELNKHLSYEIDGEQITVAKATGLMKGGGDKKLRAKNYQEMTSFYKSFSPLYASTLSALHGFNIARIKAANVSLLTPALELNCISEEGLEAMLSSCKARKESIRKSLSLRAPYLNEDKSKLMEVYDLNAPAPLLKGEKEASALSYTQGMELLKAALSELDPGMGEFVDYMHEKKLVESSLSKAKIGGAFCENFAFLKEQRIFSSYMSGFSSLSTQAHELGHAWHYHLLEGLPAVLSDVPMTLAESASTFNEGLLREHVLKETKSKQLRFEILWQELKAGANFLLHIPARFSFELSFLKAREKGVVSAKQACELMDEAWELWFGNTTASKESFLWCFKLHFYKCDQFLYNFPYTVGFLISTSLLGLKEKLGDDFFKAYQAFLKDSGKMSVDDLVQKHLGYDIKRSEFWDTGINKVESYINAFEKEFKLK